MAVLLAIGAVMVAVMTPGGDEARVDNKQKAFLKQVELFESKQRDHMTQPPPEGGAVYCPADETLAEGDANYGKSVPHGPNCLAGTNFNDCCGGGNAGPDVRFGMVPVVSMGLPKSAAFSRNTTYRIKYGVTIAHTSPFFCWQVPPAINVYNSAAGRLLSSDTRVYMDLDHGATPAQGGTITINTGTADADALENADSDSRVVRNERNQGVAYITGCGFALASSSSTSSGGSSSSSTSSSGGATSSASSASSSASSSGGTSAASSGSGSSSGGSTGGSSSGSSGSSSGGPCCKYGIPGPSVASDCSAGCTAMGGSVQGYGDYASLEERRFFALLIKEAHALGADECICAGVDPCPPNPALGWMLLDTSCTLSLGSSSGSSGGSSSASSSGGCMSPPCGNDLDLCFDDGDCCAGNRCNAGVCESCLGTPWAADCSCNVNTDCTSNNCGAGACGDVCLTGSSSGSSGGGSSTSGGGSSGAASSSGGGGIGGGLSCSFPGPLHAVKDVPFTGQVSGFTPVLPVSVTSAQINWGNGTSPADSWGTDGASGIRVFGTNTYGTAGLYSVNTHLTLTDFSTADCDVDMHVDPCSFGPSTCRTEGLTCPGGHLECCPGSRCAAGVCTVDDGSIDCSGPPYRQDCVSDIAANCVQGGGPATNCAGTEPYCNCICGPPSASSSGGGSSSASSSGGASTSASSSGGASTSASSSGGTSTSASSSGGTSTSGSSSSGGASSSASSSGGASTSASSSGGASTSASSSGGGACSPGNPATLKLTARDHANPGACDINPTLTWHAGSSTWRALNVTVGSCFGSFYVSEDVVNGGYDLDIDVDGDVTEYNGSGDLDCCPRSAAFTQLAAPLQDCCPGLGPVLFTVSENGALPGGSCSQNTDCGVGAYCNGTNCVDCGASPWADGCTCITGLSCDGGTCNRVCSGNGGYGTCTSGGGGSTSASSSGGSSTSASSSGGASTSASSSGGSGGILTGCCPNPIPENLVGQLDGGVITSCACVTGTSVPMEYSPTSWEGEYNACFGNSTPSLTCSGGNWQLSGGGACNFTSTLLMGTPQCAPFEVQFWVNTPGCCTPGFLVTFVEASSASSGGGSSTSGGSTSASSGGGSTSGSSGGSSGGDVTCCQSGGVDGLMVNGQCVTNCYLLPKFHASFVSHANCSLCRLCQGSPNSFAAGADCNANIDTSRPSCLVDGTSLEFYPFNATCSSCTGACAIYGGTCLGGTNCDNYNYPTGLKNCHCSCDGDSPCSVDTECCGGNGHWCDTSDSTCRETYSPCQSEDCPTGQQCAGNNCTTLGCSAGNPPGTNSWDEDCVCTADNDCQIGLICGDVFGPPNDPLPNSKACKTCLNSGDGPCTINDDCCSHSCNGVTCN